MTHFDIQGVEIEAPYDRSFDFLSDLEQLPLWTHAFAKVSGTSAVMRTPAGEVEVTLESINSREVGQIDTRIHFPDGTSLTAWSRLVGDETRSCYSFILSAPPAALEELEGGLDEQRKILTKELATAKEILERG